MAKTVTRIINTGSLTGTITLPERQIPAAVHTIGIYLHRCHRGDLTLWPDTAQTLTASFEASFDNRATWVPAGGFGAQGGIKEIDLLTESRYTGFTMRIPASGQQRWIRGTVTVINGPIKTAVEIVSVT